MSIQPAWSYRAKDSVDADAIADGSVTAAKIANGVLALTPGTGSDSWLINSSFNTIDGSVTSIISGSGSVGNPNRIGATNGVPNGGDWTPGNWGADAAYPANAANVAVIAGGYDHVVNQLAGGVLAGGHNFIKYHLEGHSLIAGGSYNLISGGRSFIGAGRRNAIVATTVSTAGNFNVIGGGDDNTITDTNYGFIGGGRSNRVSGTDATIAGGRENNVSGNFGFAVGRDHVVADSYAAALGYGARTLGDNSLAIGRAPLAEAGDAQSVVTTLAARTTNATATNLTATSGFFDFPDDRKSAFTCKVTLIAQRDGSASGNNDGNYAQASWSHEFGGSWDGTNATIYDAAGIVGPSVAPTRDITVIRNDLGAGTVNVEMNTGALRLRVRGLADVDINWVARFDLVMTLTQ